MIFDWYSITLESLRSLWMGFFAYVPVVAGAIVVFVIGWFVSVGVGKIISEVLNKAKFNKLLDRGNWKKAMDRANIKVNPSEFVGAVVKWVLVIAFLLATVDILGLREVAGFLRSVLAYIPNVIVAAMIFVVTAIVVDIVEKLIRTGVESIKVGYGSMISLVVKWSIWIFAVLTILFQLGVAPSFMETLFTGFVAVVVISVGLAFGLGGKDVAAELLQDLKRNIKE